MSLDDILNRECGKGTKAAWKGWKETVFPAVGIKILFDGTGLKDDDKIEGPDAAKYLKDNCQYEFVPEPEMSVDEWREEFQRLNENRPKANDILYTRDGAMVKLTIEFHDNKEPFIFARVFVPDKVGEELGWFAQSMKETGMYGLKVILYPRSRNEVIRTLGVKSNEVGVTSIRILRPSDSGKSLLGEVAEW